MNIGMLWHSKRPIVERVTEAVEYYRKKYGQTPDRAFANIAQLDGKGGTVIQGVTVYPMRIPLGLLWIGVEEAAEAIEERSVQLLMFAENDMDIQEGESTWIRKDFINL